MNTDIWGSPGWLFLHSVALNYPEKPTYKDKVYMKTFFEIVGKVLPCNSCKKHYEDNLKKLPIQLNSKNELVMWTIDLHNLVNKILDKKIISRKQAYNKIMSLYEKNNCDIVIVYVVTLVLLYIGVKMII